eukprot:scaffold11872_cov58-Cyclotella_meneghiniana.AAC.1
MTQDGSADWQRLDYLRLRRETARQIGRDFWAVRLRRETARQIGRDFRTHNDNDLLANSINTVDNLSTLSVKGHHNL